MKIDEVIKLDDDDDDNDDDNDNDNDDDDDTHFTVKSLCFVALL